MVIYKGGMIVGTGLYWSPMDGQRVTIGEEGRLPDDDSRTYLRISPACLLIVAPLFGMMYVIFLPLFGIGVFIVSWLAPLISVLAGFAMTGVRVCGRIAGRSAFFDWSPSRAHFSGAGRNAKKIGSQKSAAGKKV